MDRTDPFNLGDRVRLAERDPGETFKGPERKTQALAITLPVSAMDWPTGEGISLIRPSAEPAGREARGTGHPRPSYR